MNVTGIIIPCIVTVFYLVIMSLFSLNQNFSARSVWLLSLTASTFIVVLFAVPEVDVDLLFLPIMALPVLTFSWKFERVILVVFLAIPIIAWLFIVGYDLIGSAGILFGVSQLFSDLNIDHVNFILRLTVIVLLSAEVYYFTQLTSEIERELYEARVKSGDATRRKGDLLAIMSHEIRTPMNGIIGMVDILSALDTSQEQKRIVAIIRNSAFSLLRVINDILDVSKIDAGNRIIEKSQTDLQSVMEDVAISQQPIFDSLGVKLVMSIDTELPRWVFADGDRLKQVLLNVLNNTIKYYNDDSTGRGGVLYFSAEKEKDDFIIFKIQDQGIGTSKAVLKGLFKPFMRSEGLRAGGGGGLDLEMEIANKLMLQMSGQISAESEEGCGTTLTIRLPLPEAKSDFESIDLSSLNIEWLTEEGGFENWKMNDTLVEMGLQVFERTVSKSLENYFYPKNKDIIFILQPHEQSTMEIWQKLLRAEVKDAKFILLSPNRSDCMGQLMPDVFRIQMFPILMSDLTKALGVLSGRQTPDIRSERAISNLAYSKDQIAMRSEKTILLVEDDEINRIVLLRQLEIIGYKADFAKNGKEGFDKWAAGRYDIVLSDCQMPLVDGFEMASMIRVREEETNFGRTPIIAITANASKGDSDKCFACGMDDYISKPLEITSLEVKLQALLQSRPV